MTKRMYRRLGVVAGVLVVSGALAATATAILTASSGGAQLRVDKRTSNTPSTTSSAAWVDLPGASVGVTVPIGTSRLFDVPFFAESRCTGPGSAGWCAVRIVAVNSTTGAVTELSPVTGMDYAFDSDMATTSDDLWEGHGMERSGRLAGGTTYIIKVQYAVTANTISFWLDDWHLAVHTNA